MGEHVAQKTDRSYNFMEACVTGGQTIYGVNTGFGGSANTSTENVERLQLNLIKFLNCGVISAPAADHHQPKSKHVGNGQQNGFHNGITDLAEFSHALPNEDPVVSSTIPESWVRATLLIRGNALSGGHSGVRSRIIGRILDLLNKNITPVIPLRGSISASGDLIPLSYIAATLQGSSEVEVWEDDESAGFGRRRTTAESALAKLSFDPFTLGPKEGLAIVNGTAVSAAVASLALHDAHQLLVLSQILTAMGVEALRGAAESFDPFFSAIRPHAGQREVSRNIRKFLQGSKLLLNKAVDRAESNSLCQDRYSIRTAPQWLGPQIEDLLLADKQISIELNSTTDNPVINIPKEQILQGGNFQAISVTSAMEKTRLAIQSTGRLLFSQATELINPDFNNGLPPNLTADEPSENFLLKGIDISIASLQAELGFLSSPVMPHVQSAEMSNQAVNSLALLSARYTHTALNVLSQLSAAYTFTLCQALDLRVLNSQFLSTLEPILKQVTLQFFGPVLEKTDSLHQLLWVQFKKSYYSTTAMDSSSRFVQIIQTLQPNILAHAMSNSKENTSELLPAIRGWTEQCSALSMDTFRSTRSKYAQEPDASDYLGSAARKIYRFVRFQLGIPFQVASSKGEGAEPTMHAMKESSLGVLVSRIHGAIQDGRFFTAVMDCLREAENIF
ncbi:MAG: hypothetical protein Q9219_004927 [cf. Caloplaca sp. 3 TL-2023]